MCMKMYYILEEIFRKYWNDWLFIWKLGLIIRKFKIFLN